MFSILLKIVVFWRAVVAYITLCLFAFLYIENTKTLIVSVAKQPSLCDIVNFRKQGSFRLTNKIVLLNKANTFKYIRPPELR